VFVILLLALVALVVTLVGGWLLILWLAVWLIVKHPILSLGIAVYIALVVWLGGHDALALASYAAIALAIWRLVHKHSFQRIVGRRLQSSWRESWEYDRGLTRDDRAGVGRPAGLEVGCSAQQTQAGTHERGELAE
jgi:hypothetical protein